MKGKTNYRKKSERSANTWKHTTKNINGSMKKSLRKSENNLTNVNGNTTIKKSMVCSKSTSQS